MAIIEWCNLNNGFLSGILSLLTIIVGVIAIAVSIHTAKLPYKKKLKLSSSFDIALLANSITRGSSSEIIGISVNAANVGSRNVNISYLGILIKDKSLHNGNLKLAKLNEPMTGTGIIAPSEVKTESFRKSDLVSTLSTFGRKTKVFLYARDTEGEEYKKKLGYAHDFVEQLSVV